MDIRVAQDDMRNAYLGGGPGILVSGLVWLIAGITAFVSTEQISVLTFFLGGMLIHPLGIFLSKIFHRSGKHEKNNPLATLAMESTFILFIGLFIAYSILQTRPTWFYPIMLLMIGGRYLLFSSIYGMRIYWFLGSSLLIAGIGNLYLNPIFYLTPLIGGIIEIIFSLVVFNLERDQR